MRRIWLMVCVLGMLFLGGCAGSVKRGSDPSLGVNLTGAKFSKIEVALSDKARALQSNNAEFSPHQLGEFVRRKFEDDGLVKGEAPFSIRVLVEEFRIRHVVAAIMFGFLAGADSIDGEVQVLNAAGAKVHGFHVSASYALGGYAGGQDGSRMNWLYGKFAELAAIEVKEVIELSAGRSGQPNTAVSSTAAKSVVQQGAPAGQTPLAVVQSSAPTMSESLAAVPVRTDGPVKSTVTVAAPNIAQVAAPAPVAIPAPVSAPQRTYDPRTARLDDSTALPYVGARAKQGYAEWLTKPNPRAFALSERGHWAAAWGDNPADQSQAKDPSARALAVCAGQTGVKCRLYAVDGQVVWQ